MKEVARGKSRLTLQPMYSLLRAPQDKVSTFGAFTAFEVEATNHAIDTPVG